jgi:hypothetical protein
MERGRRHLGRTGTVGNATDRHVNAEIGDLLQRIEAFRGFTIVTTNMRHAIDPASLRRFRFAIDFPMPSQSERLRLWQQAFERRAGGRDRLAGAGRAPAQRRQHPQRRPRLGVPRGGRRRPDRCTPDRRGAAEGLRKHDQPMPSINWEVRS